MNMTSAETQTYCIHLLSNVIWGGHVWCPHFVFQAGWSTLLLSVYLCETSMKRGNAWVLTEDIKSVWILLQDKPSYLRFLPEYQPSCLFGFFSRWFISCQHSLSKSAVGAKTATAVNKSIFTTVVETLTNRFWHSHASFTSWDPILFVSRWKLEKVFAVYTDWSSDPSHKWELGHESEHNLEDNVTSNTGFTSNMKYNVWYSNILQFRLFYSSLRRFCGFC